MSNCSCHNQNTRKQASALATLSSLRQSLAPSPGLELVFRYEGEDIRSGYHVTEVKAQSVASLDCGADGDERSETVVQLWDVPEDGKSHMQAGKFLSIIDRVTARVTLAENAPLIFEVGKPGEAMRLYCGGSLTTVADRHTFTLSPYSASCKPADKAMNALRERAPSLAASCC